MLSRRDFVKGGVALVSIGTTANSLLKGAIAFAAQNPAEVAAVNNGKILVLVQLAGGNDGISTVVPFGDPGYRTARKQLAIPDDQVLKLDEGIGLHPKLTGLKGLWDAGKLAVVRGVGYPNQNYSHFKSMAIWEAGDPELKLQEGWLGRTLEAMESQSHDPFFGFNIGSSTPPELRADSISIPSVSNPADYGFKLGGRPAPNNDARSATLALVAIDRARASGIPAPDAERPGPRARLPTGNAPPGPGRSLRGGTLADEHPRPPGGGWAVPRRGSAQLNDEPQPQVRWALGLSIEKPAWLRPSL